MARTNRGSRRKSPQRRTGTGRKQTTRKSAARTARRGGRRMNNRGRGGGQDLRSMTRQQLYERARRLGIGGRSMMNKNQLIRAIRNR